MKKTLILSLLSVAAAAVHAKSGVESVQLDYVALDPSVECTRILFQSSQHFKGTIFAVPRVVLGSGIESARIYELNPSDKPGIFDLNVRLYFPSNDEAIRKSGASTFKKDTMACNWDKVRSSLNKDRDADKQILRVAPIPLTSIEVKIPGIAHTGLIGRTVDTGEESDILDYVGKSLSANFKITEAEKDFFQSRLVSADGIATTVKFRFQARSRAGSVTARIDLQNLAQNFSAAAAGKGFKYLGSADLSATLKSSVTENSVQVTTEAGAGEDIGKITNLLIDKILKEVGFAMQSIQLNDSDRAKAGSGQIAVAAVVEILKTKMKSEISFSLVSAAETASAQTEIRLQADKLPDANTIPVTLTAGYNAPSVGLTLAAGQSITVTPAYVIEEEIKYEESRTYLTMSDIQGLDLVNHFEDLASENMSVRNLEINGTPLAQGKWTVLGGYTPISYRWVRFQRRPDRTMRSYNIPANYKSMAELPVYLSFSELAGRTFEKLGDLLTHESPYWKASYDEQTGRLLLTARQNLGTIRVRERMRGTENIKIDKPIVLDQIFQQRITMFGSEYTQNYVIQKDAEPIVFQKSIVINFSRPKTMTASELKQFKSISLPATLATKP